MKKLMLVAMVLAMESLLNLGTPQARAEPFTCSILEKGTNKGKLLFTATRTEKPGQIQVVFSAPDGKEAVSEEAFLSGGKLGKYLLHQKQLGHEGSLEIRDGKARFSYTKDGKTETDEEDAAPNLIVGPTTVDYLHANWDKLMAGDDVDVRYASLDRKETVGFKFFKIEDKIVDGKPVALVKMKPSSFVIAAIVKPLIFTFDKTTKRLLELDGRTLPKQNVDGKWKDLDALIVYKY